MKVLWAVLGAVAIVGVAHAESYFERPYWVDRGVIEVIGRARLEVAPARAEFTVTFRDVKSDNREAMMAASDRARLAAAAIRSRGGDSVSVTSRADISPIFAQYRNREGERVENERADQIDNYVVSVTLRVVVRDTTKASNVRAAAMAVGPEDASELDYSGDNSMETQRRAFAAAVEDAAERARISAQHTGAVLGRLLVLQEGRGPCLGQWMSGAGVRGGARTQNSPVAVGPHDNEEVIVTGSRIPALRLTAEDIARMQLPEDVAPIGTEAYVCAVYAVGP